MNKSRIRIISINLALVLLITLVGWWGWSALHPKATAVTTTTTTVAVNDVIASVSASGTVISPGDIGVSPTVSAQITKVNVKVGDRVSAGTVMATLENTSLLNSLNQAKAALNQAKATVQTAKITFSQDKAAIVNAQKNLSDFQANAALKAKGYQFTVDNAQAAYNQAASVYNSYSSFYGPSGITLAWCATLNTINSNCTTLNNDYNSMTSAQNSLANAQTTQTLSLAQDSQTVASDQQAIINAQQAYDLYKAQQGIQSDNPSDTDFGVAQAAVLTAQSNVQIAQQNFDATYVKAPVAGTVASISAVVGQNAPTTSSSTIGSVSGFIVLTDVSGLEVKAGFSESDAAKLVAGQNASFTFSALTNVSASGKLISVDILPTTASGATTYNAYFSIDGTVNKLKPGMSATVSDTTGAALNALSVASQAVSVRGSGATVNVVTTKNGKDVITPTRVTVGLQGDSLIQILSGVKAGDKVVLRSTTSSSSNGFPASGVPSSLGGAGISGNTRAAGGPGFGG